MSTPPDILTPRDSTPAGVLDDAAVYVVAATLTRSTQDGWSTTVATKLLLWMGGAQSEDEAVGAAVRTMLKESKGYSLQMHVVSRSPHTDPSSATREVNRG